MKKIQLVIPVYGGIVQCDKISASFFTKRAKELQADMDKQLDIVRDHEGRHEHPDHDCHLVEVEIDPLVEAVQVIRCPKCGNWEELGGDDPRDKSQSFEWKEDCADGTAIYVCTCGNYTKSDIQREAEDEMAEPLFLARFTQREGEYEYDQLCFLHAADVESAEKRCIDYMRTWWTGNEDEPSMKQDGDNEQCFWEIGVGRCVELDSVREIKSFQEAIEAVGMIDPDPKRKVYLQITKFHEEEGGGAHLRTVSLSPSEYGDYLENATPGEKILLIPADSVQHALNREAVVPFEE